MTPSSPRNIRLSSEALNALKILKQCSPGKSTAQIVSESLVNAATAASAAPILKFNQLDPAEYLGLQARISEMIGLHQQIRRDILRIRPSDKTAAERSAQAIEKLEAEITALNLLRKKLSKTAQATVEISPKDTVMLIEQVAPTCHQLIKGAKDPEDFTTRKNAAILRLVKAMFPDIQLDD